MHISAPGSHIFVTVLSLLLNLQCEFYMEYSLVVEVKLGLFT